MLFAFISSNSLPQYSFIVAVVFIGEPFTVEVVVKVQSSHFWQEKRTILVITETRQRVNFMIFPLFVSNVKKIFSLLRQVKPKRISCLQTHTFVIGRLVK